MPGPAGHPSLFGIMSLWLPLLLYSCHSYTGNISKTQLNGASSKTTVVLAMMDCHQAQKCGLQGQNQAFAMNPRCQTPDGREVIKRRAQI